jgi:hypothetical protein
METNYCWLLVIVGCALLIGNTTETKRSVIQSVSTGVSFGFCFGYCQRSINVSGSSLRVVSKKLSLRGGSKYPLRTRTTSIRRRRWRQLLNSLNWTLFLATDEQIGCPDCADGGAEWIEIRTSNRSKRVTFEFEQDVPGLDELMTMCRSLRRKYVDRL